MRILSQDFHEERTLDQPSQAAHGRHAPRLQGLLEAFHPQGAPRRAYEVSYTLASATAEIGE